MKRISITVLIGASIAFGLWYGLTHKYVHIENDIRNDSYVSKTKRCVTYVWIRPYLSLLGDIEYSTGYGQEIPDDKIDSAVLSQNKLADSVAVIIRKTIKERGE